MIKQSIMFTMTATIGLHFPCQVAIDCSLVAIVDQDAQSWVFDADSIGQHDYQHVFVQDFDVCPSGTPDTFSLVSVEDMYGGFIGVDNSVAINITCDDTLQATFAPRWFGQLCPGADNAEVLWLDSRGEECSSGTGLA